SGKDDSEHEQGRQAPEEQGILQAQGREQRFDQATQWNGEQSAEENAEEGSASANRSLPGPRTGDAAQQQQGQNRDCHAGQVRFFEPKSTQKLNQLWRALPACELSGLRAPTFASQSITCV